MRSSFSEIFEDVTKHGKKIPKSDYLENGKYPIIDQGQNEIAGYYDSCEGIYSNVPAIIFGDHTRVIKYVESPFFIGADGVKILRFKTESSYPKYLYYYLLSCHIPNTGYNRHFKWLKEFSFSIADIAEQKRVVANLDLIDELVKNCNRQIQKLDKLIKSRFVEMFGDVINNNKGWAVSTLGEIAEIKIGPFGSLLHKEDYIEGGHALVNPSHIISGKIITDEKLTVSEKKYKEMFAYHLKCGDVVLGRRGEMGRCAVVQSEGLLCGTGSMILRPKGTLKAYFLQNILSSSAYKKIIEDKAVGVTMLNLNVPIVSSLTVPLLPINLQEQFIVFLHKVEQQKATVQKSIDKLETLKKSLMQEYFGGV